MDTLSALEIACDVAPETKGSGLRIAINHRDDPWPIDAAALACSRPPLWAIRRHGWPDNVPTILFASAKAVCVESLLHELAHVLPVQEETFEFPKPQSPYREATEKLQFSLVGKTDRVPWHRHEMKFLRVACHLVFRFMEPGDRSFDWELSNIGGWRYSLAGGWVYYRHLAAAGEFEAMRNASFREIIKTPLPEEFVNQFEADTNHYFKMETSNA